PTLPFGQTVGIFVGGPGDLLVQSGRNVDLGTSTGIQTFGNLLNVSLPTAGADITIETGLGPALQAFAAAAFTTQSVNPRTAAENQFAEPLQLFSSPSLFVLDDWRRRRWLKRCKAFFIMNGSAPAPESRTFRQNVFEGDEGE